MKKIMFLAGLSMMFVQQTHASLLTDANDARSWQGANVGTFAQLYYGANTLANRQLVIDNKLLDDGVFNTAGYSPAKLIANSNGGGCLGTSSDTTGIGGYGYSCGGGAISTYADSIDNLWFQTDGEVGKTVFDFGFQASTAIVFNTIDHGPLPDESIESTVYLSNDQINWVQAVTERVWLEGFNTNTGIQWDGFTYAVGTGTNDTFRYASVIHGGPGALEDDGDNELNGLLGARADYTSVPEPSSFMLMLLGALGLYMQRKIRG
jgi:PEP-CTERM motif